MSSATSWQGRATLQIGIAMLLAICLGASCTAREDAPQTSTKRAGSETAGASTSAVAEDSIRAAAAAIAYFKSPADAPPLEVTRFVRGASGDTVEVRPKPPDDPHVGMGGGGGIVFVERGGRVRLLVGYQ